MDIGLSHVITVDGDVFNAHWDVFNPNLAVGNIHEIKVFEEALTLEQVYNSLDDYIASSNYHGRFYLAERNQDIYTFKANYAINIQAMEEDVRVRTFLFISDGRPWAICILEKDVLINSMQTSIFEFVSSVVVNNSSNISENLWDITVDKFNIKYAAMIYPVDEFERNVVATASPTLMNKPTDDDIANLLMSGFELQPKYILEPSKIGIEITAKTRDEVVGVKAIFIRILWNLGIMVFIDSVNFGGMTLNNLTLARGHKLRLVFGLNFKEIKPT